MFRQRDMSVTYKRKNFFPSSRNSGPLRLLVSARDPAAAFQLAPFCRAVLADTRVALMLVAQPPASQILEAYGLPVRPLPPLIAKEGDSNSASQLLTLADNILHLFCPDAILCGFSSPDEGGIDEALMARRSVVGLAFQDFWGDLNTFFGGIPDIVLVLDEVAASQTLGRYGIKSCIVGSPRHGAYQNLNFHSIREQVRQRLRLDGSIFGLFGQPLHAMDGYRRTLELWRQALTQLSCFPVVLYRPHPRESLGQREWTRSWLNQSGLEAIFCPDGSTEEVLAACDVACSVMSNCAYDAAYLNYFSSSPLLSPVLMLFDTELQAFYENIVDIRKLPYVSKGLAIPIWHEAELPVQLAHAATPAAKHQLWQTAKAELEDPSEACTRILEIILT